MKRREALISSERVKSSVVDETAGFGYRLIELTRTSISLLATTNSSGNVVPSAWATQNSMVGSPSRKNPEANTVSDWPWKSVSGAETVAKMVLLSAAGVRSRLYWSAGTLV